MYFIKAIIDFVIVLLLVRLLIKPVEVNFNQIFSLIFRITGPILAPVKSFLRNDLKAVLLSVFLLVLIRGLIYIAIKPMSFISGAGISLLNLFQLLFQFYMVVWFISILTDYSAQSSIISMVQRAFLPLNSLSSHLGISRQYFSFFSFGILLLLYSTLSFFLHLIIALGTLTPSFLQGFGEGLILIIDLFPGFFSIVIIVGALLSWVSPDPYNPIVQTIYGISEPLLIPFRRIIPSFGGLDISPIIALLCFQVVGGVCKQILLSVLRVI